MKEYKAKSSAVRAFKKANPGATEGDYHLVQFNDTKMWAALDGEEFFNFMNYGTIDGLKTDFEPTEKPKRPRNGAVFKVWEICENNKSQKRKHVIAICVEAGINYNTARTQYQAWFKASKKS